MFGLFRKNPESHFSEPEKKSIVEAIREAERHTSGEVRVFIESHCRFMNPLHRAQEIFARLKMSETLSRNAVLVYVAMKDRQLAVFGDQGIHQKVGDEFWNQKVSDMLAHFNGNNYALGIAQIVQQIGEALAAHFPYHAEADKNELPDDIVFGK